MKSQAYIELFNNCFQLVKSGDFEGMRDLIFDFDESRLYPNEIKKINFAVDQWEQYYLTTGKLFSCDPSPLQVDTGELIQDTQEAPTEAPQSKEDLQEGVPDLSDIDSDFNFTTGRGGQIVF